MGSTLSTIRDLFESRLGLGFDVDATTDPSLSLLNGLINESVKKIAREENPWELLNETPSYLNKTEDSRTADLPSTIIIPKRVYVKTSSGTWKEMKPKSLNNLIEIEGPNNYLNDKKGDPDYYTVRGSKIIFNKIFSSTVSNGIAIISTTRPTDMSNDTDTCELDEYRNLQIIYGACVLFYESEAEDNGSILQKYITLYNDECSKLKTFFEMDVQPTMRLDQSVFGVQGQTIQNPNVLFTS